MIEETVYQALSTDSALTALVGARIYPEYLPEDCVYPAVVYGRTNTERLQTYCGTAGAAESLIEVLSIAKALTESRAVAAAVRAAMETIPQCTVGDDAGDHQRDMELHQVAAEFSIFHAD